MGRYTLTDFDIGEDAPEVTRIEPRRFYPRCGSCGAPIREKDPTWGKAKLGWKHLPCGIYEEKVAYTMKEAPGRLPGSGACCLVCDKKLDRRSLDGSQASSYCSAACKRKADPHGGRPRSGP